MLNEKKTILCIVAHPDDEVLGPGGTLIKHSLESDKVNVIIFSDGEGAKKTIEQKNTKRLQAAQSWCKITGCKLLDIKDFPDQKLDTVPQIELVSIIEKVIDDIEPDIVYIHNPTDINKDHQIIADASLVALRPMRLGSKLPEIRAFETPSSTEQSPNTSKYVFLPNLYVSITSLWDKKIQALECYKKELGEFPHPRSIKSLEALAIKRGTESGLEKAEAFIVLKKVVK